MKTKGSNMNLNQVTDIAIDIILKDKADDFRKEALAEYNRRNYTMCRTWAEFDSRERDAREEAEREAEIEKAAKEGYEITIDSPDPYDPVPQGYRRGQ